VYEITDSADKASTQHPSEDSVNVPKRSTRLIAAFIALIFTAALSSAQTTRGELAGNVTDATGAVVPNAQVTATNSATGGNNQTVSTSSGSYRFTALPIGIYNVTATAPGFSAATNTGVQVLVNTTSSLNIVLAAGAVTETITVDASGARIETESSDIGGTVSARQIVDLPLNIAGGVSAMRSPENFVFLVPGTTGPGAGSGGRGDLNSNGVFRGKIAGGQSYGAEILLDGASVTRSENGSSFDETSPSVEALQEFKVTTSTPSPEFGRTTAGIESFVTKSGTNAFHGTAFDIYKNEVLDANGWFETGLRAACAPTDAGCRKKYATPVDKKNDYGGSLGGPVRIPHLYNGQDRTFFFFSWEQFRQTLSATPQSTLPSAAERTGDFSGVLGAATSVINPCTGQPVLQNQIFDPATENSNISATNPKGVPCRLPFAGNVINPARFSKAATALIQSLPTPNQAATTNQTGFFNNYAQTTSFPVLNTAETIRVDQTISDKAKLFASYSSRDNNRIGANNFPTPFSGTVPQDFNTHYVRAGFDYTFTPNLLNHINLGYNRTNSLNFAPTLGGANYAQQAGIAGVVTTAFPRINFDGLDSFSSLGTGSNGDNIDNGSRVNDSISYQKGRHSMKFGVDLRYQQYSVVQKPIPTFNFVRSQTDVALIGGGPQQQSGNSFASFLLGLPDNASQTAYIHNPRWNSKYFGVFFEDDFKASPNLVLNLGVRYDIDMPRHEATNSTSNFSLTAPDPHANNLPGALVFGPTCHCNTAWADTYYKDIAPRVGFAYQLPGSNGKSVLRGGGAFIYGPLLYDDFGGSMTAGYTIGTPVASVNGFDPAFQLDSGFPQTFPTSPNLDPGQLDKTQIGNFNAVGGEFISPKMGRPSVTYNWSLQVQQELAKNLIFTIGYIGQEAQNLRSALENINNIPLSDLSLGSHLDQDRFTNGGPVDGVSKPFPTFPNTASLFQALRPFPQYDFIATDCCLQNVGHSSYHALVTSLERRFSNGLSFNASYTWSRNITDADSALANNIPNGLRQDQNVFDHRQEKSISIQNIPNQFVVNYLYELPFGKGRRFFNQSALLSYAIGGWQIGGVQRYQSGQPVSFGCASGIPGYQNCIRFSNGPASLLNPVYQQNKLKANQFTGISWFGKVYDPSVNTPPVSGTKDINQAAFIDKNDINTGFRPVSPGCNNCSYAPFTLGTGIDRVTSIVTSPRFMTEDFSLIKNIPIHEALNFQLKIEAIDAFNRHNFGIPNTDPRNSTFGIPQIGSQIVGPRTMQLTGRINF